MLRNVRRKPGVIRLGCAGATTDLVITTKALAGADAIQPCAMWSPDETQSRLVTQRRRKQ